VTDSRGSGDKTTRPEPQSKPSSPVQSPAVKNVQNGSQSTTKNNDQPNTGSTQSAPSSNGNVKSQEPKGASKNNDVPDDIGNRKPD